MAMEGNNMDIVRLLLAQSDIQLFHKVTDGMADGMSVGMSVLHYVCLHNSVESVRLFLAHPSCTEKIVNMVSRSGDFAGQTAEMVARQRGNHDCAKLIREYLGTENKPEEVDDVQRMVEMIKSGKATGEGTTRLEEMTLTEVAKGIEKINADQPIIEAANRKVKNEHNKELAKLEVEHKKQL